MTCRFFKLNEGFEFYSVVNGEVYRVQDEICIEIENEEVCMSIEEFKEFTRLCQRLANSGTA